MFFGQGSKQRVLNTKQVFAARASTPLLLLPKRSAPISIEDHPDAIRTLKNWDDAISKCELFYLQSLLMNCSYRACRFVSHTFCKWQAHASIRRGLVWRQRSRGTMQTRLDPGLSMQYASMNEVFYHLFYHLFFTCFFTCFLGIPLNTCSKHVFWDPPKCFLHLWSLVPH